MISVKITHIGDKFSYEGGAERVFLPGVMGGIEIEAGHIPIVSLLSEGTILLEIKDSLEKKAVTIHQGLMRFDGQCLYVMAE